MNQTNGKEVQHKVDQESEDNNNNNKESKESSNLKRIMSTAKWSLTWMTTALKETIEQTQPKINNKFEKVE